MAAATLESSYIHSTNPTIGLPATTTEDKKVEKKKNKKKDKKKTNKKTKKEPVNKPIREAVGVIIVNRSEKKVLMLGSRKDEKVLVVPRDDCQMDEHPEKAAVRILHQKAGVDALFLSKRIGCFSESNKKGRVVAHHWMYEVHNPTLLDQWPESSRKRVWMTYEEALKASENKRMARLALEKIVFD